MDSSKEPKRLQTATRVWTFDGGGPSVISQLIIIDEIMHRIQWNRKLQEVPRPCDYADLMVGTGLGALIAILLGRLRLTAKEALDHTIKFGQHTFTGPNESTNGSRFNLDKLIEATRNMLSDCGLAEDAKMIEDTVTSDQNYAAVTAVPTSDLSTCRLLRTYHHPGVSYDHTILDAVSATMAVPDWFPSVTVGSGLSKEELIGGSLGFNNPTKKALEEAECIYGSEQRVSIVLSFGSGQEATHSLPKHDSGGLQEALSAMAQDGGTVTSYLAQRFLDSPFYYRFSLDSNENILEATAWSEDELASIHGHTKNYMERISSPLNSVAEILVENKGLNTLGQITRMKTAAVAAKAVPRISPYYVDRDDIYDSMNRSLVHDEFDGQRVFILHGMGGVGKTQLASFFAHKNRKRYKYTFFIDASSVESINADLQSAIRSLGGIHSQDTHVDALRFLAHPDNHDWLVIFDNADDPKLPLSTYFPDCHHGTIVITGRNHALVELAPTSHWNLQGMDDSHSVEVLFKAAKREHSRTEEEVKTANELCKLLGGLPLALVHVGSYCHTVMISFLQYLERFKMHRSKLMATDPPLQLDQYSYSTYTSIGLSYSLLDESARGLLHLLTFLHPSIIRLDILRIASKYGFRVDKEWALLPRNNQHSDPAMALTRLLTPDGSWSDVHVDPLLNQLQTFSLISLSHSNGQTNITIHPLVQSCIRDTLSSIDHNRYFSMAALLLSSCSRFEEMALFQHLPAHIAELESCKEEIHPNDLASFAYILRCNGSYVEAMKRWEKVRDECWKMNGEDHRSTLRMLFRVARCLYNTERYKEAEVMVRGVVKTQERVLGDDDDDTMDSYRWLANILSKQQKTQEAEHILRRLLILSGNKHGQEHRKTLDVHWSLASNLDDQQRYPEAEAMSRSILSVAKKTLGENDDITLATLNTLSLGLIGQKKWAEAEIILSEVIAKGKIRRGKHHPNTLNQLFHFSMCLIQREELDEAENILREVLKVQEKIHGHNHPRTVGTRKRLEELIQRKETGRATNKQSSSSRFSLRRTLSNRIFSPSFYNPKQPSKSKGLWKLFRSK